MTVRLSRRLFSTLAVVLMGIGMVGQSVSAETIKLKKDTDYYLQGHSVGEEVEFRKGTEVILNELGEVSEGTLNEAVWLRPVGWQAIIQDYSFAAGYVDVRPFFPRMTHSTYQMALLNFGHLPYKEKTKIVLNEEGLVLSGTIKDAVTIALTEDKYGFVKFKSGEELVFYPSGRVKSGTLAEDTKLRPVGWRERLALDKESVGYVEFRAGEDVVFDETGQVLVGTIKKTSKTLLDESGHEYASGTKLSFADGVVTEMAKAVTKK